jgi:hypothetical protein
MVCVLDASGTMFTFKQGLTGGGTGVGSDFLHPSRKTPKNSIPKKRIDGFILINVL